VLFPDPPFRDANARTCIRHQSAAPDARDRFRRCRASPHPCATNVRVSGEYRVYVKVTHLS
jgi:hypothetical protein